MCGDILRISDIVISKNEETLLKCIARTGLFLELYKGQLSISTATINSCIKKDLIIKDRPVLIFTKLLTPYKLTEKGKYIVNYLYMITPYQSNARQIEHDYILGKIYLSLNDSERETWRTEGELMLFYPNSSVVDGVYTDINKALVGIEVITSNYSENDISSKKDFISKYCDKAIILNTKDIFRS